jgi:hypothetical protein
LEVPRQGGTDTARWPVLPRRPSREEPTVRRGAREALRDGIRRRGSRRRLRIISVDVGLLVGRAEIGRVRGFERGSSREHLGKGIRDNGNPFSVMFPESAARKQTAELTTKLDGKDRAA